MSLSKLFTKPIDDLTFAVIDTETTGMYPQFSRVMDIGIVIVKNGEVVDKWQSLINPQQSVPRWITHYTHLAYKDVKGKPLFSELVGKISKYLKNKIFVAHNVNFDYWFLFNEMKRLEYEFSYPKLCTVLLGRKLLPNLPSANLDMLADYYNLKISQRHRALPDAEAAAYILIEFIKVAKEKYGVRNYFDLEKLQWIYAPRNAPRSGFNAFGDYGGNKSGLFDGML